MQAAKDDRTRMKYSGTDSDDDSADDSSQSVDLVEPGDVYAFGYGYYGQLGVDAVTVNIPVQIPNLHRIIKVAAGEAHSLAVSETGAVYSWGCNRYGQLGHGDTIHRRIPTEIEALKNQETLDVACGTQHSVVLLSDGQVYTFGCGSLGRLGHGDDAHAKLPKLVTPLRGKHIVQISAGNWYTMALTDHGAVWSWGYNRFGQTGHGKAATQMFPRHISSLYNNTIVKMTCGKHHALFWSGETGDIYSIGSGTCGQLGTRNRKIQTAPVCVERFSGIDFVSVASGYNHNLVLDTSSNVYAWGYFSRDHLGLPESQEEYFPNPFPVDLQSLGREKAEQIFAGGWHSALITDQGSLYTWGCGFRGRLGIGEVDDEYYPNTPVKVEALRGKNVVSVACGGSHTLVIATPKE